MNMKEIILFNFEIRPLQEEYLLDITKNNLKMTLTLSKEEMLQLKRRIDEIIKEVENK